MAFCDVVDQFLNQNGLADTGTAEQADLAALGIWCQQVNDLDAGDEDFSLGGLIDEFRGRTVNWQGLISLDRAFLVNRLTDNVHDTAEGSGTDRHVDRRTGIGNFLTADQTVGGVHGDCPDGVFTKMLCDFENQSDITDLGGQCVHDCWQIAVKLHIHHGAQNLGNPSGYVACLCHFSCAFV